MTPLESFAHPATARSGLWRPILGTLIISVCWFAGMLLVIVVFGAMPLGVPAGDGQLDARIDSLIAMDSPEATMATLISFFGLWIGVWIAGRFLHRQRFSTFFSPDSRIHAGSFLKGAVFALAFSLISVSVFFVFADSVRPGLSGVEVAGLFVPIVALIFLQATGEELMFRGYLLQQLAARSRHWIVWAVLPSLAFGAMHIDTELGVGGYYWGLSAFLSGLLFCVLVWRCGNLWGAAGLHVGFNTVSFLVLGAEGVGTGTQLWLAKAEDLELMMQVDVVMVLLMLMIALSPAGRIFGPGSLSDTPKAFGR